METVLQNAEKQGINKIFLPAIEISTHEDMLALENRDKGRCMAMMGVHPCSVKENYREELDVAAAWLEKRKFVAVGEIGLDLYWDKTFFEEQKIAFREQIGWALKYDLPVSIHSRQATDECIEIVSENKNLTGVFHCFSGTIEQANQITELGMYLGIGGVVTYKNSGLDKVIEQVSLDHIVLETDAPYLTPVPFRGKRNEPSYLRYVVDKLAMIKKVTSEEISQVTTRNAEKIFKL